MSRWDRSLPGFPGGTLFSAAVQGMFEVGGERFEAKKCQMSKLKVQMEKSLGERKNEL